MCGARHIEQAAGIEPSQRWRSVIAFVAWVSLFVFGGSVRDNLKLLFGDVIGQAVSLLIGGLVIYKWGISKVETSYALVEKNDPIGTSFDAKLVMVILVVVVILGVLLWQIPHPGKS